MDVERDDKFKINTAEKTINLENVFSYNRFMKTLPVALFFN